jgi:hypothetical protein
VGIDAVALVHCRRPELIPQICEGSLGEDYGEQLEHVKRSSGAGLEELPLLTSLEVLGSGRDFVKIFTAVRFDELEEDPIFLQLLAHRIVELLPAGAHDGPRLFFYPDSAEPGGDSYAELLTALEDACIAASVKPVAASVRRAWRDARMQALEAGVESILKSVEARTAREAAAPPQSKSSKSPKGSKKPGRR